MPSEAYLKAHPHLKSVRDHLHYEELWHFTKKSVPRAAFIGLFVGCMPMPFQMLVAALIAIPARANMIICVVGCWISNPVTIPPLLYAAYKFGKWVLGTPSHPLPDKITFAYIMSQLPTLWQPVLVGCISFGLIFGTLGYIIARVSWRLYDRAHHDSF